MEWDTFVNSLETDSFEKLMVACILRMEKAGAAKKKEQDQKKDEAIKVLMDTVAAVKKRIAPGLVNAKRLFDVISDEIEDRLNKK